MMMKFSKLFTQEGGKDAYLTHFKKLCGVDDTHRRRFYIATPPGGGTIVLPPSGGFLQTWKSMLQPLLWVSREVLRQTTSRHAVHEQRAVL